MIRNHLVHPCRDQEREQVPEQRKSVTGAHQGDPFQVTENHLNPRVICLVFETVKGLCKCKISNDVEAHPVIPPNKIDLISSVMFELFVQTSYQLIGIRDNDGLLLSERFGREGMFKDTTHAQMIGSRSREDRVNLVRWASVHCHVPFEISMTCPMAVDILPRRCIDKGKLCRRNPYDIGPVMVVESLDPVRQLPPYYMACIRYLTHCCGFRAGEFSEWVEGNVV